MKAILTWDKTKDRDELIRKLVKSKPFAIIGKKQEVEAYLSFLKGEFEKNVEVEEVEINGMVADSKFEEMKIEFAKKFGVELKQISPSTFELKGKEM